MRFGDDGCRDQKVRNGICLNGLDVIERYPAYGASNGALLAEYSCVDSFLVLENVA